MRNRGLKQIATLLLLLGFGLLTACGGGGGGGDGSGSLTEVGGTVSKGPVAGAAVAIYALDEVGVKGELLAEATTDGSGAYLADLGEYEGPVLAEATGGSYLDEGSGETLSIPADASLRAVHSAASGVVTLHVSGLTELAVQVAEAAGLSLETIAAAYDQLEEVFGFEAETTAPVAPVSAALAGASDAEVDYALTLATLSRLAFDWNLDFDALLAELADELAVDGVLSAATLAAFDAAAAALLDPENPDNATGLAGTAGTGLASVGRTPATLTLFVGGDLPAGSIGALQLNLVIPEEAFVALDAEGEADVTLLAEGIDPDWGWGAFWDMAAGTLNLTFLSFEGLGSGELVTIDLDLVLGDEVAAEDFVPTNVVALDPLVAELDDVEFELELVTE
ncbi:MAG: hypothetical protein C0617_05290 [Desulfuromonas sp.]|uniref:hypothetical protein n=1 Tax=Desulfuromonas sp. TaxID=892 RepID=UPI000CC83FF6|nr:hypothetical protein [Desulfuromonas sp.]PLX85104.1 MAG: hypothetical protein C0617_05290 [Desulfuromonas sp.]